jgi:hypothetical protein
MKTFVVGSLALLLGVGTAAAAPIVLPGGPLSLQLNLAEQLSPTNAIACGVAGTALQNQDCNGAAAGAGSTGNWGIFKVSSIQGGVVNIPNELISGGGPTIFTDGVQGQVTGIFYGVQNLGGGLPAGCANPGPGACASGGFLDLYWNNPGVNVLGGPSGFAPTLATVTAFTTGSDFLARLFFDTGVNCITGGNPGGCPATLTSSINISGTITGSGEGNGFLSVDTSVPGAWAGQLNSDYFFVDTNQNGVKGEAGERRDLRFRDTFNLLPSWNGAPGSGITGLSATDPVTTAVVPEPATLGLLGFGLVGLGAMARRKKKS